jgi:colanic acid biosynthesis glycosyl transferase WcaI
MHILIMGQHFAPEEISGAVLATELACGLVEKGHQITFITSTPNYPYGKPFTGYKNRLISREKVHGVDVIHIWSYLSPQKTMVRRLLNYGTFSLAAFLGGLSIRKPHVIISSSPPLPLGISAYLLSRFWKVPWLLRVEDLFPDLLMTMGILKPSVITKKLYSLEKFLYQKASHIAVISDGFRDNLINKGISGEKISVIPVWADPDQIKPMTKDNALCRELKLESLFVILYAGNIGLTSSLDELLSAAKILENHRKILFLIVGEGVRKKAISEAVKQMNLTNVRILPYQPRKRYSELLALADMSVVTLNKASSINSLPGKTFNIMASARPILAISDSQSELGKVIEKFDCGIVAPEGQAEELADKIVTLLNAPERQVKMGNNGRDAVIAFFNRSRCIGQFERILIQTTNIDNPP